MKLTGFLAVIGVAAALATGAIAAGQKKPPLTGAGCKPMVSLIVVGTATSDASATSVSLKVTGGNRFARVLFAPASSNLTVTTTATTKVTTSSGQAVGLASVKTGGRVLTQYRVCKADLKGATAASLTTLLTKLSPKKVVKLG